MRVIALLIGMAAALSGQTEETPLFGTTVVIPFGLRGDIYYLKPGTLMLPKFEKLEPVGTIYAHSLNIKPREFTEGFPGVTDRFEWFAIDYHGRFYIDKPGKYDFSLISDDGSKLFIDNKLIIDNDHDHPPRQVDGRVTLSGGIHRIRIEYFQGPRTGIALMLGVLEPGEKDWHIFNTDHFRPPAHPEDWKYGNPEKDLADDPPVGAGRKKLKEFHPPNQEE